MSRGFSRIAGWLLVVLGLVAMFASPGPAGAAEASVGPGTATSFAVLGGSTVTNTGPSAIIGDAGLSPGTSITGFPPATLTGSTYIADGVAVQAQSDALLAYTDAAGRSSTESGLTELGGRTLTPGVYSGTSGLGLTGELTLDAAGDPYAVFIFQAGSTLTTASDSAVKLLNGAQACNVFWQVGSSATLGTDSHLIGTVLAFTSVTANTRASVEGRLLALNGAVTLDTNTITRAICDGEEPTTPTTTDDGEGTTTTSTTTGNGEGTTTTSTTTGNGEGTTTTSTTTGNGEGTTTTSTTKLPGVGDTTGTPPSGGTTAGSSPNLPMTGRPLDAMTAAGLVSVALGALLLMISRRRSIT